MKPESITALSAATQAFAAFASLAVSSILAGITYKYMTLTKGILKATEESAASTRESVKILSKQFEQQALEGNFFVSSIIHEAISQVENVLQKDPFPYQLMDFFLKKIDEVLRQSDAATAQAARISPPAAKKLSDAFRILQASRETVQRIAEHTNRMTSRAPLPISDFELAQKSLRAVLQLLYTARQILTGIPIPEPPQERRPN